MDWKQKYLEGIIIPINHYKNSKKVKTVSKLKCQWKPRLKKYKATPYITEVTH